MTPYNRALNCFFPVSGMRLLFLLILLVNVAVLAFGQGFFGTPPSEQGREPRQFSQRNQDAVKLGAPQHPAAPLP